jgi:hypothetical protein
MNPHPTKLEIAQRLRRLAVMMEGIAGSMEKFNWLENSQELTGAAGVARQWVDEIEAEVSLMSDP